MDLMAKQYSKLLTRPLHFDENLYFLEPNRCLFRVVQDVAVPTSFEIPDPTIFNEFILGFCMMVLIKIPPL